MKKTTIGVLIILCFVTLSAFSQNQPSQVYLGNGYKEAKWGMSPDKVKEVLVSATVSSEDKTDDGDTYIAFTIGDDKELTCYFYENQLYCAQYKPIKHDGDDKGAQAVLIGLTKKYGQGKYLEGYADSIGMPLVLVEWNDGVTEIRLKMMDQKSLINMGMNTYPSSTLEVRYTSLKFRTAKDRKEKEINLQQEKDERNRKLKNVENDL
jgi:hypothetical protein